jgi:hypothetical protein
MFEYFCLMFSLKSSGTLELTHFIISSRWSWTQSHPFSDMKTGKIKNKSQIHTLPNKLYKCSTLGNKKIYSSSFWHKKSIEFLIIQSDRGKYQILRTKKMVQNSRHETETLVNKLYHRHSGTWNRWPSQSFGVWCPNWVYPPSWDIDERLWESLSGMAESYSPGS